MGRVTIRPDGCWDWRGYHLPSGYATVDTPETTTTAHRLAYTLFIGPIADDLDADHLCQRRGCVNPYHLEAVPHQVNIHRMPGLFGRRARAKTCDRGHDDWTRDNDGRRRCRTCRIAARQARAA